MYKKNDIFEVEIEKITFSGKGIGKVDGKVFFVDGVLPGEVVKVREIKEKENYSTSKLLEIIEASPRRITPEEGFLFVPESTLLKPVPYSPGYCYYYTDYEHEVEIKDEQFRNMIGRLPGAEHVVCLDPIPSPKSTNYRNKIILHSKLDEGVMRLGYYYEGAQQIMDLPACPLARPELNELLAEKLKDPGFIHTMHDGYNLTLRYTDNEGPMLWRNKPHKKDSWLKEETCIGTVSVPKGSFFQVNPDCGNILMEKVGNMIDEIKPESVVDLYCGAGIFALTAATKGVPNVVGIDSDDKTIAAARYNATSRGFDNCTFESGDAEKLTNNTLKKVDPEKTLLIIDPPRNGLGRKARGAIIASGIKHLFYISCGPDTLMRDMKMLIKRGFELKSAQMVDMFPRTSHFETVCYLERV